MNRFFSIVSIITALLLIVSLAGCSGSASNSDGGTDVSTEAPVDADFSANSDDMFTKRDLDSDYSLSGAVKIELKDNKITSSSSYAKVDGTTVTLTEEATYVISGSISDGSVVVNAPDTAKLQIVLNNAEITSSDSAAIFVKEADKVVITLAEGSENVIANGGEFAETDEGVDGAVFSKQDITFNGKGSLTVTSPAGHGIVSKDDLVITAGSYSIVSASHGIDANDSIRLRDASFTVEAGKDALHCENADDTSLGFIFALSGSYELTAEGDGISAGAYVQIEDGEYRITAGGGSENGTKDHSDNYGGFGGGKGGPGGMGGPGRPMGRSSYEGAAVTALEESSDSTSMKGIKAVSGILINGGEFDINSADDSIHSDTSVIINGGKITIASGDDGIHAENKLTVTAGKITITESYEGLEATDIEILGGDIDLKATDDGLNSAGGNDQSGMTGGRDGMYGGGIGGMGGPGGMSAGSGTIVISGGTLHVNASGDGIDANGSFEISGGSVTVVGPTQGDTATLDYDISAVIKGGTFIGTGASGMAQTFSDSSQGVISLNVGNQPAGTVIKIEDSDGNEIITASPELNFAVMIISCPELVKGETYTVYVGDQSGEFKAE